MNSDSSPDPTQDQASRRRPRLVGVLTLVMLASFLLTLSPLPLRLLSGITSLVALVLLILLIVQAVKERRYPLAVIGALLGVPATLMIIASATIGALFYGPMAEFQECQSTAITEQARVQCSDAMQGSMAEWISGLFGG
ncbi:hypothetical protein GCM10023160_12430 [Brachybacterium paraconglomeratum]|uniref:hypothetical protein n=1 Tax=Brachybacterium paraconglomeratum TaxID=173362 RepID=UPI0031F06FBF